MQGIAAETSPPSTPMAQETQKTIAGTAALSGRGLFTGEEATVRFKPAPANHGVVFVRKDGSSDGEPVAIPAHITQVAERDRRTTLRRGSITIETCEHCLCALAGLGVDNVVVEVTGPELPGGDGSAQPYVDTLLQAGVRELKEARRSFKVREPVTVSDGDAMLAALPAEEPRMELLYDLDHGADSPIPKQLYSYSSDNGDFVHSLAPARTFVLMEEAKALQAAGIGTHLTPEDVLVIGDDGLLGENGLRFDDEMVRHKVLDLLGDLCLLGGSIHGRIVAYKSGHALNHELVRRLTDMWTTEERGELLRSDGVVDIQQIQRILPHRFPMLLIDRVLEVEGDRRAVGVKNVTINEEFFLGHYPGTPIMPGVLIVEAMAQLSGVLLSRKLEHTGKVAVLLAMDKVKLRRAVTPGDQLLIEAETMRVRSRSGHTRCHAYVGPHAAAEAQIKFMLVDAEED